MPLTPFQEAIARLLAKNRDSESYLAGGAALHIEPNSLRYSNDLDYFQDSDVRVASAFQADATLLRSAGYEVDVVLDRPGFVRAIVRHGGQAEADSAKPNSAPRRAKSPMSVASVTKVEWVHDTAWRFMPLVKSQVAGLLLHPVDLAINKLLALVGRDEPRDFLDTVHTHQTILPLGALIWAASGKDPGFSPGMLLDLLRRRGKIRPEDLARLRLVAPVDLTVLRQTWLDALTAAASFIQTRPSSELGCLYYCRGNGAFVMPDEGADVATHFGRPGGVLPTLSDA